MLNLTLAMARKDLSVTLTRSAGLVQALLLGLLLIFMFSLSRKAGDTVSPQTAATIFWLASSFCQVLIFNTLYSYEEGTGARLALLLVPAPVTGVWLGKGLAAGQRFLFGYAPVVQTMGPIQKIFYIHLPLSWWALVSFFVVFICSAGYLAKRRESFDLAARAAAEIGVVFTSLCLITGIIWGRRSWGVWWTWDPRLSTALVMWFVYVAYLIMGSLAASPQRKALVRSVLGIVAFLDVPLVFLSARMWRSVHPAVFASREGGLEPEMKLTVFVCVGAMGLLWLGLFLLRKTQLTQESRIDRLLFRAGEQENQDTFRKK